MDRLPRPCILLFVLFYIIVLPDITHAQRRRQPRCERGSCNPATGDLLIGREMNLTATSTCGTDRPQRYCVVSYLQGDTKCFTCDSMSPWRRNITEGSHRIENVISSFKDRKKTRWWQAKTGRETVSIQLDLEAEFRFTHLIMTFKTFRPKAMLIERSYNFGKDWKVYRYFAQNCDEAFPNIAKRRVNSLSDVICDERYSAETPSTAGEVIFRVLPPFIPIPDPYSEAVQDLLKLTNLRINFTQLHTLGDTLLDSRPEIKEKYYYAVYDITVRGSCSCYGHASRCLPVPGYNRSADTSRIMVHGQCDCTHNTKGLNCEMCQDFYHDTQWKPARPNQPNVCKKCNCNNHATECHFDASIYEASGLISGGVCDNCKHNTRGVHCEECKDFYFQDPSRDIRDPEICQPCDCDSFGSKNNGLCEQITDDIPQTVAGRCICKQFVTGSRCDRCQQNYWNLQADNPLGCEPCSCNPDGVVDDVGCDEETGLCRCKRYVTGRNCDECYPGFYGLSADNSYGCKPCDCDIGGAARSSCDQTTGQCECRPHITGKRCMKVDPGFFYAHLDYYLFEAEFGVGTGNARVYIREPIPDAPKYWTGPGYMKVMEGDSIEFTVSGLPFSTFYDLVIRYDPRMPELFEDVSVTVIRLGQVDPNGLCGEFNPRDDLKTATLQPSTRYSLVGPPSCLEKDISYKIRIGFNSYKKSKQNKDASLLIDSLLVVPNVDYIPIYQGPGLPEYMKNEFLYNRCDNSQYTSVKMSLTDQCLKHTFSISAVLHNGALDCDCDRTGSTSVECNPSGGQCECKPNVVGRRCDQCAPGTYGFGPQGCSPCNCHQIGARDSFCNDQTGQCACIGNVAGRACDQCRVGFWGFPQCRPCQCNGNAETCEPLTGACIDCRNNTSGNYCERCDEEYYGDPRIGVRIPCRACMCPNGPNSTLQHADSCSYDPRSQEVYCNCKPGYSGNNCDSCIENYYGVPSQEGGMCQPCVCNNNIDPDYPGSCDGSTGECLKCLYNTEGFACEHCLSGYHGNAVQQSCSRCVCNNLGTDTTKGECDRASGQCPCLPNVVGVSCDQCAPAHWNLTSEMGCAACSCDPTGSTSLDCNQLTGQCDCLPNRGGMQCGDCEDLQFGDPSDKCQPCDCNPQGSNELQCNRTTGQCECVEGVTGYKCDRCARGTTGDLPNCVPCGECFDNWDRIIMDLKDQTHDIVKRANDVSVTGAIKAFDEEFRQMQQNVDEIKQILSSVNFTQGDIQAIQDMLDFVKTNLTENTKAINQVDKDLRMTSGRVKKGKIRMQLLKDKVEELKKQAQELKDNATNIQIREVGGAFDKIKEAERQSQKAQDQVDATDQLLQESAKIRMETDKVVQDRKQKFQDQLDANSKAIDMLEEDILKLGGNLSDINSLVCGDPGAPCSSLCGGGGCGKCGGVGCNGAVTMAQTALNLVHQAEDLLNTKTANASQLLIPQIQEARRDAMTAKMDAQEAYDEAAKARNVTEDTRAELEALLDRIRDFLIGNMAKPEDVEEVLKSVLDIEIPLKPEQIQEMADKINMAVSSLTDIDRILNETSDNRAVAEDLKKQAEEASDDAQAIRNTAQNVQDALDEAKMKQEKAEKAIEKAKKDIQEAEDNLIVIGTATGEVDGLSRASLDLLEKMRDRLDDLTRRYTGIKVDTLDKAEKAADEANKLAKDALEKAKDLKSNYAQTDKELNDKYDETKEGKELAEKLKARADKIYKFTETKLSQLKDVKEKLEGNEEKLNKLDDEINRLNMLMDEYLKEIRDKAKQYDTC